MIFYSKGPTSVFESTVKDIPLGSELHTDCTLHQYTLVPLFSFIVFLSSVVGFILFIVENALHEWSCVTLLHCDQSGTLTLRHLEGQRKEGCVV